MTYYVLSHFIDCKSSSLEGTKRILSLLNNRSLEGFSPSSCSFQYYFGFCSILPLKFLLLEIGDYTHKQLADSWIVEVLMLVLPFSLRKKNDAKAWQSQSLSWCLPHYCPLPPSARAHTHLLYLMCGPCSVSAYHCSRGDLEEWSW